VSAGVNLTGHWLGIYNYPAILPATEFRAELADRSGRVSGTTVEPGPPWEPPGTLARAAIKGIREGSRLSFTKIYDEDGVNDEWIDYEGVIAADGNEIEGRWTIPGQGSGGFLMVRQAGASLPVEARAAVKL
jgi:hypothetical protein